MRSSQAAEGRPLIMPPQEGIHNMIEKVMPRVCAQRQSGRAVGGPAHMYMKMRAQKWMIDRRYE